jgi:hypothetical protein
MRQLHLEVSGQRIYLADNQYGLKTLVRSQQGSTRAEPPWLLSPLTNPTAGDGKQRTILPTSQRLTRLPMAKTRLLPSGAIPSPLSSTMATAEGIAGRHEYPEDHSLQVHMVKGVSATQPGQSGFLLTPYNRRGLYQGGCFPVIS